MSAALLPTDALRRALHSACRSADDAKLPLWEDYQARMLAGQLRERRKADSDPQARAQLIDACRPAERTVEEYTRAFLFFCRVFGTVVEPRDGADSEYLPFIPYPHQEDLAIQLIQVYFDGGSLFVEKARDMGATWLCLHFVVWLWLFVPNNRWHLGSRTEDFVDVNPGSMNDDTLFGRCEIIVENLPAWLQPAGHSLQDKEKRQRKLWHNPERPGNRLSGEAASPHFSRQTRKTGILVDELPFWEHQRECIKGTVDTCRVRVFLGSPNPDADACKEFIQRPGVRLVRQHWSLHPHKTLAWYEHQLLTRSEEEIANELDLSWEGGSERRIYSEWDTVPQAGYPFQPGWPLVVGIDFGRSDDTALVYGQRNLKTKAFRFLACHLRAGEPIEFFLPFFGKPIASGLFDYSEQERALIDRAQGWIKRGAGLRFYGDPSGSTITQAANTSVLQILAKNKVYVNTNPRIKSHDERQTRTRLLLRNAEVDRSGCRLLDESMRNYRRPASRRSVGFQKRALHNRHSHACTAVEYIAANLTDLVETAPLPTVLPRHVSAWERRSA